MRWPQLRGSPRTEYTGLILMAVLIGLLGAIGNAVFRAAIAGATTVTAALRDLVGSGDPVRQALAIPLGLVAGGVVLLVLERIFPGQILGYGFPRFLEMVHLEQGRVRKRWMILKTIGAAIALGSGASVGREGPIATIGGSIGSAIAQLFRIAGEQSKVFVACGAAAGIATTFNAPIAAVMFAQEILLHGELALAHFSLIVISTATAVVASHAIIAPEVAFTVGSFALASYWELATYALMGIVLGLLAVAYSRTFYAVHDWFARLPVATAPKLLIGLALVGTVGIVLPQTLSDGYPVIGAALLGELPWDVMGILAVAKMATSILSLSCGAPGGIFGPIFFIGAMSGGTFRHFSELFLPGATGPRGSYAILGLATFLAACTHAPLTAIFLLFEMTGSYEIALPALITTILGVIVASSIEPESIDTLGLARAGKSLRPPREQIMDLIPVASAFHREFDTIDAGARLADLLRIMSESRATNFPVLDAEGRLLGTISLHQIRPLLLDPTGSEVMVAADLCDTKVPTVTTETSLGQALGRMEADDLEEIPVVDKAEPWRVIGLLSRADVIRAYNRALLAMRTFRGAAGADEVPQWSKAYRVTTLAVPGEWAGQSLKDLDWRRRFGVTVLAVHPHDKPGQVLEVPDPEQKLEAGDSLVIAGPAPEVRRFERAARGDVRWPRRARANEALST